jgi:hypothetical protein
VLALALGAVVAPSAAAQPTCGGKAATIVGSGRSETIVGTAGADVIVARGGDDIVRGGGGNDLMCGGGGDDWIRGAAGQDTLVGAAGDDRLDGGTGIDTCYQGPGRGPRVSCERPTMVRQLVVGGPGSGQVGEAFWAGVGASGPGPWNISDGICRTGRINYGASGIDEYRFALEFPLSGLPSGATIVRAVLSVSAMTTAPSQGIYGYLGDGSISVADAIANGGGVWFEAPVLGYQTVDVTDLVTPAVVTAGWAGFLQARATYPAAEWACRVTDPEYPRLRIDYRLP